MKALILAAGEGKRMGPLTEKRPKPMLPVAGKPFLEHSVNALKASGITDIIILTGYHGMAIKDHFGNGEHLGVSIRYLIQPQRLGTAHAVGMARDTMDCPFICLNGDVIINEKLISALVERYEEKKKNLMTLVEVDDISRFGMVETRDDKVIRIVEKAGESKRGLINGGIYLFEPKIFDIIDRTPLSPRGEYEITHSIEVLASEDEVGYIIPDEPWVDIGSPWDLLNSHEIFMKDIKKSIEGDIEENVHIKGELILKEGAVIKSGSYIEGNVFIDENAIIGPNAYVRGATYIGKGSKVGAASEIKNSIIMDNTNIPHHNYVGDSIIGSGCNLGSGTKVANLRLDEASVSVTLKGKRLNTGRRKLGVIIGDDVKTGINSTMDPGTILFSGSTIGPGAHGTGTIGKKSRIF